MTSQAKVDLLVILSCAQPHQLLEQLAQNRFSYTQVDSSGGLITERSLTLWIGLNHGRLDELLALIEACCKTRLQYISARAEASHLQGQPMMIEAMVGGATVMVFEVDRFEQI